jgi:hypothetical protein
MLVMYVNDVYGSLVRGAPDDYIRSMFFTHIRSHSPVCLLNMLGQLGAALYAKLAWPLLMLAQRYAADVAAGVDEQTCAADLRTATNTLVRAVVEGLFGADVHESTSPLAHRCTGCAAEDMPSTITNPVLLHGSWKVVGHDYEEIVQL